MVLTAVEQNEPPAAAWWTTTSRICSCPPHCDGSSPRPIGADPPPDDPRIGVHRPRAVVNLACRKHFIDDKLEQALEGTDAVVILGAGSTPGPTGSPGSAASRSSRSTYRSISPERRRRSGGCWARCRFRSGWSRWISRPTTCSRHGRTRLSHRLPDLLHLGRCDSIPHRSSCPANLAGLRAAAPGSRLVFTYVRRTSSTGPIGITQDAVSQHA